MSRQSIARHYARISSLWPADLLRPNISLQSAITFRKSLAEPPTTTGETAAPPKTAPLDDARELRNINALYSLIDNRYMRKYPVSKELLNPQSNPTYYEELIKELEMAPKRNWLQNFVTNLRGKVRFS